MATAADASAFASLRQGPRESAAPHGLHRSGAAPGRTGVDSRKDQRRDRSLTRAAGRLGCSAAPPPLVVPNAARRAAETSRSRSAPSVAPGVPARAMSRLAASAWIRDSGLASGRTRATTDCPPSIFAGIAPAGADRRSAAHNVFCIARWRLADQCSTVIRRYGLLMPPDGVVCRYAKSLCMNIGEE